MSNSSSSRKKHERKKVKSSTTSRKRKTPSSSSSQSDSKINSTTPKETKGGSSDYESDPETSLEIPPDYDESNASSSRKFNRCLGTVHWDPNSIDGSKVGHRIRVFEFKDLKSSSSAGYWKHGRIIRYDPVSHKHKVVFFGQTDNDDEEEEEWLMLKNENFQLGGNFVWALVKGFAWWPAQVLHCHFGKAKPNSDVKDLTTQPVRDGYVLVEFFDSDEVAAIRNTPDFLRPFQRGFVDNVIAKNKKKRNMKAIESGVQEEIATQEVRNDAASYYAECAFKCANRKANYYLGMKVEIFRGDINYPVGLKLIGTVRQYSMTTKKWLVAYDPFPVNKEQYSPTWINLLNKSKSSNYKIIDPIKASKRKFYEPNEKDIFPFLFGYKEEEGLTSTLCRGCVADCAKEIEIVIKCAECMSYYHPDCVDPPLSQRTVDSILKSGERWVCNKCIRCVGCRELEIAFGTRTIPQPSSLFLEGETSLNLCNACIPMYEKQMYCPTCAHIWDDVRFQRIQKRVQKQNKQNGNLLMPLQESIQSTIDEQKDTTFQWTSPSRIEDSWFYPEETSAWGYNEASMLFCEQCSLWVHAGCAQINESEYTLTTDGKHPIYSNEFLCRTCCKRKCLALMNQLVNEDNMGLFAEPVTDKVAHNYSDIIKNPMDLSTMMIRAQEGAYRNYAWLRESFELMVLNALTFNIGYTTYWNEAKRFYKVCKKKIFNVDGKGAPPSKYVALIDERFRIADQAVQAEKDRIKTDDTAEKKDLVAGSLVLKVKLGPLDKPLDPPSCVPCLEVRLSPLEALFCSWMDCCFTCGSSGAADTFLFCVDCGEAYHSFCCMAPIHSMNEAAVSGWRCPNCKLCEITGEVTDDETKLIYCEMCDRAFSIDVIDPPLLKVPSGLWICGQCVDCVKCHNTHYNGVVSRACWSKEPSICRGCLTLKPSNKKKPLEIGDSKPVQNEEKVIKQIKQEKLKKKAKKKHDAKKSELKKKKKKPKVSKDKEVIPTVEKTVQNEITLSTDLNQKTDTKEMKIVAELTQKQKDEMKEAALVQALNEAKSRGLPDGWTCFYGAANRKRWRSPPPNLRVFDSIPKALLFAEKMKGLTEYPPKQSKQRSPSKQKPRIRPPSPVNKDPFNLTELNLDKLQVWREREAGYDDNTSLMSDAECLFRILEPEVGFNFNELFDFSGELISSSVALQNEPQWVFQRAARFVRFVKRLSKRNQKEPKERGNDKGAQTVVCKMASSFIYVICRIFNINILTTIKSHYKVLELLLPQDQQTGTVALSLPVTEPTVKVHRKGSKATMDKRKNEFSAIQGNILHTEEGQKLINNSISTAHSDLANALLNDSQFLCSLPHTASSTMKSVQNYLDINCSSPLKPTPAASNMDVLPSYSTASPDRKRRTSAQDYDIANALLGLTSPVRSTKKQILSGNKKDEEQVDTASSKHTSVSGAEPKQSVLKAVDTGVDAVDTTSTRTEADQSADQVVGPNVHDIDTNTTEVTDEAHSGKAVDTTTGSDQSVLKAVNTEVDAADATSTRTEADQSVDQIVGPNVHDIDTNTAEVTDEAHSGKAMDTTTGPDQSILKAVDTEVDAADTTSTRTEADQSVDQIVGPNVHDIDTNTTEVTDKAHSGKAMDTTTGPDQSILKAVDTEVDAADTTSTRTEAEQCKGHVETHPGKSVYTIEEELEQSKLKTVDVEVVAADTHNIRTEAEQPTEQVGGPNVHDIDTNDAKVTVANNNVGIETEPEQHTEQVVHMEVDAADTTKASTKAEQYREQVVDMEVDAADTTKASTEVEQLPIEQAMELEDEEKDFDMKSKIDGTEKEFHTQNETLKGEDKKINVEKPFEEMNKEKNENLKGNVVPSPWLTSTHLKVDPLFGWSASSDGEKSLFQEWKDPRACTLCLTCGDDDAGFEPLDDVVSHNDDTIDSSNPIDIAKSFGSGRLLPLPSGGWVHINCAIWSSEVWEAPDGCSLNDVYKACNRSTKLKCFGCGRPGATLGCHRGNCIKNYHFACARASGVLFMENHKLYCGAHRSFAKDAIRVDFSEPMKALKINIPNDIEVDRNLSIRCGSLVVHSLGYIQTDIDGFHSKYYITPPGYTSTRIFWSFTQPRTRTLYFMKIERSSKNLPQFVLTTSDAPSKTFQSDDVAKLYTEIMTKVEDTNRDYFSYGDLCSIFPMKRKWKKGQKAFCLNGPQFWGFGVDNVRKALEALPEAVACAVPLTEKSTTYRFCFQNPTEEAVTELQRKRAAIKAEEALENTSGCARTEGTKAVDKSTSSDRITRALVRNVEEDENQPPLTRSGDNAKSSLNDSSKKSFESNQAKYMEMKKYPMEQRLAAKRSHIHGWGLFAKIFFPKNSMIAEYMGEAIGQTIADKREKKYEVLGMGSCYMFRLDLHNIVDATNIGCMARFMNHCCAANAYAKVVTVNTSLGLEKKIVVFANQDIQIGQEITYDYKFPVEDGSLRCTCGAPNCIGRMN